MPRKPRFFIPDVAVHIVQRGRSREAVFFDDADYKKVPEGLKNVQLFKNKSLRHLLLVAHTIEETEYEEVIRIISARKATKYEREVYAKNRQP